MSTRITEYDFNNPDVIEMLGIKQYSNTLDIVINKLFKGTEYSNIEIIKERLDYLTRGIYKLIIQTKTATMKYYTLIKYSINENR